MRGAQLARAFTDERADLIGGFGFEDPEGDAGIPGAEAANQLRHGVDGERRERSDVQRACAQLEHPGDRAARLIDRPQYLPGRADERLAGGREPQPAADAVKQVGSEL